MEGNAKVYTLNIHNKKRAKITIFSGVNLNKLTRLSSRSMKNFMSDLLINFIYFPLKFAKKENTMIRMALIAQVRTQML